MATYQNIVLPKSTRTKNVDLVKKDSLRTFVAAWLKDTIKELEVVSFCDPNARSDTRLVVWQLGTEEFRHYRESDLFSLVTAPKGFAQSFRDPLERAAIIYARSFVEKKKHFVPAILIVSRDRSVFFPVRCPMEWDAVAENYARDLPPVVVADLLDGVFHVAAATTQTSSGIDQDMRVSFLRGEPQEVVPPSDSHYLIRGMIFLFEKEVAFVVSIASHDRPVKNVMLVDGTIP